MVSETSAELGPVTGDPKGGVMPLDFRGQILSKDFSDADLRGALFQGQAVFCRADLRNAQFCDISGTAESIAASEARGLSSGSFAGAKLQGAKLPAMIAEFPQLHNIEEAAKSGATVLFAMIAACSFCFLTAATFTDAAMITNSGTTAAIPGVGLTLSVRPFLYAAPLLLVAVQLYFTLTLQRYEELLSDLPSVFPDGTPLRSKTYPWIFSSISAAGSTSEVPDRVYLTWIEALLSLGLGCILTPLCIWIIWFRTLAAHDISAYSTLLALGMSLVIALIPISTMPAIAPEAQRLSSRRSRVLLWSWGLGSTGMIAAFAIGTYLTVQSQHGEITVPPGYVMLDAPPDTGKYDSQWLQFKKAVGYWQSADVGSADVSKRPTSWSGKEEELKAVIGADLKFRNLRYLRGFRSFLVKADLQDANLAHAVLAASDLRGADITSAKLVDADLSAARISSSEMPSSLRYAHLERANLSSAMLEKANLFGAFLHGARLNFADLEGARLDFADLEAADFHQANLAGASLAYPPFAGSAVTFEQLASAGVVDDQTKLDNAFKVKVCRNQEDIIFVTLLETTTGKMKSWTFKPLSSDAGAEVKAQRDAWLKRLKNKKMECRDTDGSW